jgi:hypothetical protein
MASYTSEIVSVVEAVDQYRCVPVFDYSRDRAMGWDGYRTFLEWQSTYDKAHENGLALLAFIPALESFSIEKRTMRVASTEPSAEESRAE